MKFKLILITFTASLIFAFLSVKAQNATPTFTASHLKAAENFLLATGINTKFGSLTDNMVEGVSKQLPENQRLTFIDVMKKFMYKYYNWDSLKDEMSKMYAAEFTEEELNQLTIFENTPLGKKFSDKMVLMQQKGMQLGQQIINDHRPELEQMMKDAMPEKN